MDRPGRNGGTLRSFEKGKSGNPAGRPKQRPNPPDLISRLMAELGEYDELEFSLDGWRGGQCVGTQRLRYRVGGEQSVFAFIAFRLLVMALNGDIHAIKIILDRTEGRVPPPMNLGGSAAGSPNVKVIVYPPEPNAPATADSDELCRPAGVVA